MLKTILLSALLLSGLSARAEAQLSQFLDGMTTSIYDGCIDTRSCHRLTIWSGDVVPISTYGGIYTQGMRYQLEHWFNQPGGKNVILPDITHRVPTQSPLISGVYIGPAPDWQDVRYEVSCSGPPACLGYFVSDNLWPSAGPLAVYPGYQPRDSYDAVMNYFSFDGQSQAGSGSTTLTLTSRTITTPEPSTIALLTVGLLCVGFIRNRRRQPFPTRSLLD